MSPHRAGQKVTVAVEGRSLTLSNLDKVLYPQTGLTKGEVIDYYTRVYAVMAPHLTGRALTVVRYPNGVDAHCFFEKNAPKATPDWVRTVTLPVPGSSKHRDTIDYIVIEELATLVYLANLAALELHTHQWTVNPAGKARPADQLVVDLDPGPPAGLPECTEVALVLREALRADGLSPVVKTSGSKGMQMSAPITPTDSQVVSDYVRALAQRLEAEHDIIISSMTRALRPGKVFLDWSQNSAAKTTVTPYSLRARAAATASTPLGWDELEAGAVAQFDTAAVLERVAQWGDLYGGALDDGVRAPVPSKRDR